MDLVGLGRFSEAKLLGLATIKDRDSTIVTNENNITA